MPLSVPSLFQSSALSPMVTMKNSVPSTSVSDCGDDDAAPGAMSFTSCVPAAVPSVRHSSRPASVVVAVKNTASPDAVKPEGDELTPSAGSLVVWPAAATAKRRRAKTERARAGAVMEEGRTGSFLQGRALICQIMWRVNTTGGTHVPSW